MKRRDLIAFGVAAFCGPCVSWAQQDRVRRVAVLMNGVENDPEWGSYPAVFVEALAKLGWTEGGNLAIDIRWNGGDVEQTSKINAIEAVGLAPDAILASTSPNLKAAQRATKSIPIVFVAVSDPIAQGFVSGLARPEGNITGFTGYEFAIGGKWLELLKVVVPDLARVGVIFGPEPQSQFFLSSIIAAGPPFGTEVVAFPVHDMDEVASAIAAMSHRPAAGLIFPTGYLLTNYEASIVELVNQHRLPAIYSEPHAPEKGGLISYTFDAREQFRQAANYVDRILKGAKPGELPIQQPTKLTFVVNLRTARAQGLTIPQSHLILADKIIE